MAFALLMSRLLGMLRDTVLVSQFGIGLQSDAYQLAVLIPDMIFMLVAGGGLSSAFIPIFSEYWFKDKKDEAWQILSSIVWATLIVSGILVVGAWILTPEIVNFFRDKKPVEVVPLAVPMARIVLPAQVAFLVGSVLLGSLYARKSFLGPALAPNVYNVGIILGGLLLPAMFKMGIESMAWGALVGAFIGNIVLPVVLMARTKSHFVFRIDLKHPGVKKFFLLLLPVILGFSLPSMVNLVTQKFASMYADDGVNTVLRYANNLMQAPLGIFGQSMALAVFPVLSECVATNRMDLYREQIGKTLRTVIYLGMPSGALMFGLAPQIIHLLYGYGKAVESPEQLHAMVDCLRIYSVAIFAWCMQPVLMRGFFSRQKTMLPVMLGTVMTGVFILLCMWVVNSKQPYSHLAWATNIAAILLAIVLFLALEKEVGALDRKGILRTIAQTAGISMLLGSLTYGINLFWKSPSRLMDGLFLVIGGLVCFWIYYGLSNWAGMPESEYLSRALAKKKRKGNLSE